MALTIGGRLFQPMNLRARTFRADAAQARLLSELRLDDVGLAPQEGEPMPDYVVRLNARLLATDRIPELLAHYLLPMGKTETDWSPAMAAETAAFLGAVQDEESRRLIWELAAEFVFFFLRSNLLRHAIFLSSSSDAETPTHPQDPPDAPPAASSKPSSGSGRRLSDRLPRETGVLPWLSRILRSARV